MMSELQSQYVRTNGVRLHVVQAGPPDGPLVILLHGFPEFWYAWRHQIAYLATLGYRVWAPDQRGYNLSDKPTGVGAYGLDILAGDLLGLIHANGREPAAVVGHDWGAAVAWRAAELAPARVRRMVIINGPHPGVLAAALRRRPAQALRSAYMLFFQLPWLPERLASLGKGRALVAAMRASSRPGTFTQADFQAYRYAWSQPGALTAMLNWYRAAARQRPAAGTSALIRVPTLLIWGARDRFLLPGLAAASAARCADARLVCLEQASHWVHHEELDRVVELLDSYLGDRAHAPCRS